MGYDINKYNAIMQLCHNSLEMSYLLTQQKCPILIKSLFKLLFNHGTGWEPNDRDVIWGDFGRPFYLSLNYIFKYPGV